jgi:hypothetical protein
MNMLFKYGFKGLMFIFPWLLLASCSETKETDLFTLSPKKRKELIQQGYYNFKFKGWDRSIWGNRFQISNW